MSADNNCMQYASQWQERLGWKLFPATHIDSPEMDNARDCLVCYTIARLSFLDRLRVLVSGLVQVTTKTTTENIIGKNLTASTVSVRPPLILERKE